MLKKYKTAFVRIVFINFATLIKDFQLLGKHKK